MDIWEGSLTGQRCCEGGVGSETAQAEQVQHKAANGLGFLQSLQQQVADRPFATGTVREPWRGRCDTALHAKSEERRSLTS